MPGSPNLEDAIDLLVVDDDPVGVHLLTAVLSRGGFAVRSAGGGQQALERVAERVPSLVLLDVRMPDVDGFEVCARLKADPATAEVPVLFLSGLEDEQDRLRGFEVGGVDFVSKPYRAAEVLARVRTHLALRRATLEARRAEARYRLVVDTLDLGLMLVDRDLRVEVLNHRMRDWFPPVDTSARPACRDAFRERCDDRACALCPAPRALSDGARHRQMREIQTDHGVARLLVTALAVTNDRGEVTGVLQTIEDVTDRP